jgi:hypothetical protein
MKGLYASLALAALVVPACGAGDDTVEGTRSECAYGGAITDCPDATRTPEGVCWRLVDCGAIVVQSDNDGRFDWGDCVDELDRLTSDREALVVGCIAASTCDELRTSDFCGLFAGAR